MKVVILAGGYGTRLSEETSLRPKPMVEIGDSPILWHIMKIYSFYGYNDFIICLGYKGYIIKEYFNNYFLHKSDVTFDLESNEVKFHRSASENWKVTLVDTGKNSMTGGRIRRIKKYTNNEPFLLTYGDGVGDIDVKKLVTFHNQEKRKCTITAVPSPGRFGVLDLNSNGKVETFSEKPSLKDTYINGGFLVCEQSVFDYIENDQTIFEKGPLENLSKDGELSAFEHDGFWKPMDMLRDKKELDKLWNTDQAPWKLWD
jgi:glucose-1-phosphate cytidylyltransferase